MKIATVGRGNIGGGLAALWEQAGHEVTRLGKEGGDVSEAEVVLVAVPGNAVPDALESVAGLEEKTVIDATNLFGVDPPPDGGLLENAAAQEQFLRPFLGVGTAIGPCFYRFWAPG